MGSTRRTGPEFPRCPCLLSRAPAVRCCPLLGGAVTAPSSSVRLSVGSEQGGQRVLAIIPSATLLGVHGQPVRVEVHVGTGLPGFTIVGLPDEACRESRDRVRAALLSSGLKWPQQRITVNLAPSGVRKAGAGLDLAIAVGVVVATGGLTQGQVDGCG